MKPGGTWINPENAFLLPPSSDNNKSMKTAFIAFILSLFLTLPAAAQPQGGPGAYTAQVQAAESYLNTLKTAKARYLLTAADGTQQIGTFYLNRPGKLRFEYDPPLKDFIVADGILIYFYDAQLGEQSNAPIGQTMADFLLRKNIRFSGDVAIERVMEGGGLLQITLFQTSDPGAGSLTLGFTQNPLELKKWRVVDAQGQTVEVELFQLQTGVKLDPDLFVFHDPKPKKKYND